MHRRGRGHDRRAGRRNLRKAARCRARARNARQTQRAHSPCPYRNFSSAIARQCHARRGRKFSGDVCSARAKKKSTHTWRPGSHSAKREPTRFKDWPDDIFPESRDVISMSWVCRWRDCTRCCGNLAGKAKRNSQTKRATSWTALSHESQIDRTSRGTTSFPRLPESKSAQQEETLVLFARALALRHACLP